MTGWIILAAVLAALLVATAFGTAAAMGKIGELEDKITGIYHAIDQNNERALRRCSDLEGRANGLEARAASVEKKLEEVEEKLQDGDFGDRDAVEKAIARGLDNIFNYSLDDAMSGGAKRDGR